MMKRIGNIFYWLVQRFVYCLGIACVLLWSCNRSTKQIDKKKPLAPVSLLNRDSECWCASPVTKGGFDRMLHDSNLIRKNMDGNIFKARFYNDSLFRFLLYETNNPVSAKESWTQLDGTVDFSKNNEGRDKLVTHVSKATYYQMNGQPDTAIIDHVKVSRYYSSRYLWEEIVFADDPLESFFLLVDLKTHSFAEFKRNGRIDKSFIMKFFNREWSACGQLNPRI